MNLTRRKFLTLGSAGCVASLGWGCIAEPAWLEIARETVRTPKLTPGSKLRIAQLSDLHLSNFVTLDYIDTAVKLALKEKPDLIFLTGDYVTGNSGHDFQGYASILSKLSAFTSTFAVLGNHDGGAWAHCTPKGYKTAFHVRRLLAQSSITLLENRSILLSVAGTQVRIIGTGDFWSQECDPKSAFEGLASAETFLRLILSHNPDSKELLRPYNWELMFCGHTHGGQVKIPFIGPIFLPIIDRRFAEGLLSWEGRFIQVSRGVGNLHGVRFNCRPQVNILDLVGI